MARQLREQDHDQHGAGAEHDFTRSIQWGSATRLRPLTRALALGGLLGGLLGGAVGCVAPAESHGGAKQQLVPQHSAADRNAARQMPVYKLAANAWNEIEKMERIQTVLTSRLRDLKASGEPVLSACRERELGQVGRLIAQSKKLTNNLEAALRGRDRSTAERHWLDVRANGMTVTGLLKGRCDGPDPGPIR